MTEIRRLRAEEIPLQSRISTVVYNGRRDFAREESKPQKDEMSMPPEWSWGAFEKGKLVSTMKEIKFLMRFDGHSVPMSGIGGVGTLPEARKGGLIREIFKKLLREAYEKGVIFSCLAPFSYSYYRQFGYEVCCARNRITIPTRDFSHLRLKGEFTQIFPGDDSSALGKIHKKYIENINHGICRDHWPDNLGWKRFTMSDPYSSGTFLYLWHNEKGAARGYIKYETRKKEDKTTVWVTELVFLDMEALYGVLNLIGVLSAQIDKFVWPMPSFLDPMDFLMKEIEMEQQIILRDMTRIINVKAALEKMRRPKGEGKFVIEVDDNIIAQNKGRFLVEYGPEGSQVTKTRQKPDIHCDMPVLSQLLTGYRSLENALFSRRSGLEVYAKKDILNMVFTQRPQHLTEYF